MKRQSAERSISKDGSPFLLAGTLRFALYHAEARVSRYKRKKNDSGIERKGQRRFAGAGIRATIRTILQTTRSMVLSVASLQLPVFQNRNSARCRRRSDSLAARIRARSLVAHSLVKGCPAVVLADNPVDNPDRPRPFSEPFSLRWVRHDTQIAVARFVIAPKENAR